MPSREGMGRPIPERDQRRDLEEQTRETGDLAQEIRRDRIADRVEEIDRYQKALTGRRAEDYARESGLEVGILFPEGKEVLNVGDPWQTLDLPGVTSIDYEFGEEAEFVRDEPAFLAELPHVLRSAIEQLRLQSETGDVEEAKLASVLIEELEAQRPAMEQAVPDDYVPLADICRALHQRISALRESRGADQGDVRRAASGLREAWYGLVHLERGFRDSDLVRNVIEPTLNAKIITERLSGQEREELFRQLVEQHRFVKRTKHARILKATFPDVPFEPDSFDRIVASWSLSTHMFPEMSAEEFTVYWNKFDELLRAGGAAYLWPIYGGFGALTKTLEAYAASGGRAEAILRHGDENPIVASITDSEDFRALIQSGATLAVYPRG